MKFGKLLKRVEQMKTPLKPIMAEVFKDPTLKAQIVDLNQFQLYEQGIESDGSETGQYAQITIDKYKPLAEAEGRDGRSDHITGKDTGETYKSMEVRADSNSFKIYADDRNNFFERFPKGLGLTTQSKNELIPEIKESFIKKFKQKTGFA